MQIIPNTCIKNKIHANPCPVSGEETILPEYIKVVVPPLKTNYSDGEDIDITGILVKAYYADDSEWGGVDPTELDFVPKAATYSGESDEYTDGHGVNAKKITLDENISSVFIYPYALGERNGNPCTIGKENGAGTMLITKYNSTVYGILTTGGGSSHQFLYTYYDGDWHGTTVSTNGIGTDYWTEIIGGEYITQVPTSAASPIGVSPQDMQNAGDNTVTVIWNRPGDNKVLTDTFEITVSQ